MGANLGGLEVDPSSPIEAKLELLELLDVYNLFCGIIMFLTNILLWGLF